MINLFYQNSIIHVYWSTGDTTLPAIVVSFLYLKGGIWECLWLRVNTGLEPEGSSRASRFRSKQSCGATSGFIDIYT
jgi:hypothetical protein